MLIGKILIVNDFKNKLGYNSKRQNQLKQHHYCDTLFYLLYVTISKVPNVQCLELWNTYIEAELVSAGSAQKKPFFRVRCLIFYFASNVAKSVLSHIHHILYTYTHIQTTTKRTSAILLNSNISRLSRKKVLKLPKKFNVTYNKYVNHVWSVLQSTTMCHVLVFVV